MKFHQALFILLFLLPSLVFGQKRDTIFQQIGDYEFMDIVEIHKIKVPISSRQMTEEEVVAKGHTISYPVNNYRTIDSTIYFHENEKIKRIRGRRAYYTFNYDDDWKLAYVEKYKKSISYMFWENLVFEVKELQPQVSGKVGNEIHFEFSIKNNSDEEKELDLLSNHSSIRLESSNILISPKEEKLVRMKIRISNNETPKGLVISNKENQIFNYPIEVIGFDLDDSDFFSSYFYKNQLPIDFGKQEDMVIKLDDGERLLRIYHEDDLVWNHPIGRIVNKIDIAYLEGGEYLLEIVDLKNNEKKYCRIKKEGAD